MEYVSEDGFHIEIDDLSADRKREIIIYNSDSSFMQLYDMQDPYIIMMEDCSVTSDVLSFYQYSPGRRARITTRISSCPYYNPRSLHQHSFFEAMLVLSGTVTHRVGNKSFLYREGQCCIMNRNIKHCEEFSSDFQAVFIPMTEDYLNWILDRDPYSRADGLYTAQGSRIYQLVRENGRNQTFYEKVYLDFTPIVGAEGILAQLRPLIDQIIGETVHRRAGYAHMVAGLFLRFFSVLEDPSQFCFARVQTDSGMQEYLFTKISHILEANHGRMSREELEELLNYNGEYLNRIVKKYTGMNLTEYGQTFYLAEAKKLLSETDKSIAEIIAELGFSNRSHFYRVFTSYYGVTPNELRRADAAAP